MAAAAPRAASPWSHLVRAEPDHVPASPSSPSSPYPSDRALQLQQPEGTVIDGVEADGNAAAAKGKKPAWNKPSNGVVEVGPVMGAVSWPPLSESTRASPKSSSSDSFKALSDGSVPAPPVPVAVSSPSKPNSSNQNPNYTLNHAPPARQKSMKQRTGGGSGSGSGGGHAVANGGNSPLLAGPAPVEMHQGSIDKKSGPEPSPKDLNKNHNHGNWDHGHRGSGFALQPQGDHHRGYSSHRRGGNSGGGHHQGGFGGRRDHERGGYDWNPPRGFGGRDGHMQQLPPQRGALRPFMRPPPPPAPVPMQFIPVPSLRPYMNHIGFPEMPSPVYVPAPPPPESIRNMPLVAPIVPPMVFYQPPDPRVGLLQQIEYYFSTENLCKDTYLRQRMDDQGWVPVSLIAGFNKVRELTSDIQYVLDTVRMSTILEVQGDKIRRRNDWMNWLLPSSPHHYPAGSMSAADRLAARVSNIGLEEGANIRVPPHTEATLGRTT